MRGEFVDIGGVRLYYYAAGTRGVGEPIVLLHGFPTSGHIWTEVVPLLPTGHRVVVVDLLGYGRSDRPGRGDALTLRAHADRVVALLDSLGINFAAVVGHDAGGGVAQCMAVHYPQRVSRLSLINSVAFDGWPTRDVRLARAAAPLTRHLPAPWVLSVVRGDLLRGYVDQERGAHSIEKFVRPFTGPEGRDAFLCHLASLDARETMALVPRLGALAIPVSIVWGQDDPFLPVSLATRLHAAIPGSSLTMLPGLRHFTPEEAPAKVADAIGELLGR
ncbi:MAG: putative hydrolase [Gemmatimonadetes bacterium]|nr:putative hydrolase [Gemmatimonadota bacterium]